MRASRDRDQDRTLNTEEAAAYLGFHRDTVRKMLQRGELPGVHIGRQWRIRKADLDAHLRGAKS